MANVVPLFDENNRFIGLWTRNRELTPSLGSLAELMSLAEPTLQALDSEPVNRIDNFGITRVGENISFQDGAFLMVSAQAAPPVSASSGQPFVAIDYHGIPIARRSAARERTSHHWWQFWKRA